jgi:hypothetical protein
MRTLACFLAIGLIIVGAIAQESAPSVQNILEEWRAGNREAAVQLAEQLKASAKYGDLSVEDKLLLHSFLRRAYLYAGEPAKVEEQRLEIARLSAAASRKSVNEIVELCAQGRFAEAMYHIELYDAQHEFPQPTLEQPQPQSDNPQNATQPAAANPERQAGGERKTTRIPRIIVSPGEEAEEVKRQARLLSAEQIKEQITLRRCLAQIYAADESEEAMQLATLQFQIILSLDRRYSLKDDPTLREQTTPKIHQAFRNALPKQNLALPILGSLVGGVLIATQNQGTTTGLGATFEVNNRSIESGEDYTVVQIQIVYRDSLGRIARSDSETTGILTIKDIGGNYRIELSTARGQFDVPLGPVKEIGSTEVSVRYTVDRGEAYINLKIFYPEQPPQDELPPELDLPDVSVEFAVTVTSSIGTPQTPRTVNHTISLTHTPRSRAPRNALLTLTASQRAAQANGLYILQSAGASHRLSARPDAPLWAALLRGRDYYRVLSLTEISQGDRVVVYSEHAQPVTLQWTTAEPSRGVELALRDLTSGSVLSLSRSNIYTYHPNPQETRVFEIVRTPRVRTPLIISQVSVQVSRSTGVSNITMTVNQPASVQVSLEDARGQVLYQAVRNASRGANTFVVAAEQLRQLPPGAYLMKVEAQTENGDHARRAVPVVLTR